MTDTIYPYNSSSMISVGVEVIKQSKIFVNREYQFYFTATFSNKNTISLNSLTIDFSNSTFSLIKPIL